METARPLSKEIYNKAKRLGVDVIELHFSGGNDEGFLDVNFECNPNTPLGGAHDEFSKEIIDWAFEEYGYSGAGSGSEYGDDIVYNLKENTVTTSDWYMSREEGAEESSKLEVAD